MQLLILLLALVLFVGCSGGDDGNNAANNANNANNVNNVNNINNANNSNNSNNVNNVNNRVDCRVDACEAGLLCNENTGECVNCSFDEECGVNALCNDFDRCECASGFHDCAGSCVDDTSTESCGTSCDPCPTTENGSATCEAGVCGLSCDQDFIINTAEDACVQCTKSTECPNAAASRCDVVAGVCAGCTIDDDCSHLGATPVCNTDTNTCVECADDSACNGNVCDVATGMCTQTPVGSVENCQPCTADSACLANSRCVPMDFAGATRNQAFCLQTRASGDCPDMYNITINRASVSGAAAEDYCGINENLTTCEAIDSRGESCTQNSECGAAGLDDGICDLVGFDLDLICTIPCASSAECSEDPFVDPIGCQMNYCGGV